MAPRSWSSWLWPWSSTTSTATVTDQTDQKNSNVQIDPNKDMSPQDHPYFSEEPRTRQNRIKALFKKLDVKNIGFLDTQSIMLALENHSLHSLPALSKYARELLLKCDTSRDGVIDIDEFSAYVEEKELELWKVFEQMDTSGDHVLDASEVSAALGRSGIYVSEEELELFMDAMDTNADGRISFGEWRNFLLLLPAPATIHEIFQFTFTSAGHLTPDAETLPLPTPSTSKQGHYTLRSLLAGAMAGAVSRSATAPFDRLKVYLITVGNGRSLPAATAVAAGTNTSTAAAATTNTPVVRSSALLSAIINIYKTGGFRAFFVGNGLNVAKIVPESAIKFYTFESAKVFLARVTKAESPNSIGIPERFVAGGVAGITSQFFIYPVETLKTRIQCADVTGTGSIIIRTAREMYKVSGARSFYSGLTLGLVGVFPYQALDMGIYETLRVAYLSYLQNKAEKLGEEGDVRPNIFVTLGIGAVSGSIGATTVYPLNTIRTKLQAQGTMAHPQRYTSAMDCIAQTYRQYGLPGFYKGLEPTLFKVVPAVSISYVVYEWSKRTLRIL